MMKVRKTRTQPLKKVTGYCPVPRNQLSSEANGPPWNQKVQVTAAHHTAYSNISPDVPKVSATAMFVMLHATPAIVPAYTTSPNPITRLTTSDRLTIRIV